MAKQNNIIKDLSVNSASAMVFLVLIFLGGCSQVMETSKVIWGSSTKALEKARVDAIDKTYHCSFDDCFDAVLGLSREKPVYVRSYNEEGKEIDEEGQVVEEPVSTGDFDVFIKNRAKRHIVVMGIAGSVDSTEVGIFFSQPSLTTIKLEISSLSSSAKRKVAQMVFDELDLRFSAVK